MMVFAYYKCKPSNKVVLLNFVIQAAYDLFPYTFLHKLNTHYKTLLDGGSLQDYLSIGIYNLFLVKIRLTTYRS